MIGSFSALYQRTDAHRRNYKFWFESTTLKMLGNKRTLYQNTNKETSTVFRSVVKHLGSGRALEVGKNTQLRPET